MTPCGTVSLSSLGLDRDRISRIEHVETKTIGIEINTMGIEIDTMGIEISRIRIERDIKIQIENGKSADRSQKNHH